MRNKILETYEKEEDIIPIKNKLKNYSFEELKKTNHFYYSLDEKNTNIKLLKNKFKEFEMIKLIRKRKNNFFSQFW